MLFLCIKGSIVCAYRNKEPSLTIRADFQQGMESVSYTYYYYYPVYYIIS